MGATGQQKGEELETQGQRAGEVRWEGPALAGEQEGLKLPCFGWEAGQYTQRTACGIFGTAPHLPCSPQASRPSSQL